MRRLIVAVALGACAGRDADPAPALLGERLFADPSLSSPPGQSCASCHDPAHGFAGAGVVAEGATPGVYGSRNVPTAMYASFSPSFTMSDDGPIGGAFWDGRAPDLATQALGPLLNPAEMNMASGDAVVAAVLAGDDGDLFRELYGDHPSFADVGDALAAYEETEGFHPFTSKFDDYLRGDAQLDPAEARGLALFVDPEKGNCIACHVGDPSSRDPRAWLFTDFTYDALGLPRNPAIPANRDRRFVDLGLCARPDLADRADLCGAFKVPTLRDVALTAPYGHNGVFPTLHDVVSFYVRRDLARAELPVAYRGNLNTDEVPYDRGPGEAPRLDDAEIDDVVAFLETLTDR